MEYKCVSVRECDARCLELLLNDFAFTKSAMPGRVIQVVLMRQYDL